MFIWTVRVLQIHSQRNRNAIWNVIHESEPYGHFGLNEFSQIDQQLKFNFLAWTLQWNITIVIHKPWQFDEIQASDLQKKEILETILSAISNYFWEREREKHNLDKLNWFPSVWATIMTFDLKLGDLQNKIHSIDADGLFSKIDKLYLHNSPPDWNNIFNHNSGIRLNVTSTHRQSDDCISFQSKNNWIRQNVK